MKNDLKELIERLKEDYDKKADTKTQRNDEASDRGARPKRDSRRLKYYLSYS